MAISWDWIGNILVLQWVAVQMQASVNILFSKVVAFDGFAILTNTSESACESALDFHVFMTWLTFSEFYELEMCHHLSINI